MTATEQTSLTPVRKTITVKASVDRAFRVFTDEIDSWWPRSHHVGASAMTRSVIEGRIGGRCFSEHDDGTHRDWGSILAWDPPHRFVMAWRVTPMWQHEPDLAKASEVEVRFTPEGDGLTRVDLEHRYFERHGAGFEAMRTAVADPNGWNGLLRSFKGVLEPEAAA